jgi:signal transduction histidine kinase
MDNFLEISVIDTGVGIKEEDFNKLFKLFGFLEKTKDQN